MKTKWIALFLVVSLLLCGTAAVYGLYANIVEGGTFSLDIQKRDSNFKVQSWNQNVPTEGTFYFDVYINGELVADNVWQYEGYHPVGSSYQITDFSGTNIFTRMSSGSYQLEGTITENMGVGRLYNHREGTYLFDLNLDPALCKVDVYINGSFYQSGATDFFAYLRPGTTYTFTNIQPAEGYTYTGPAEFTGTMGEQSTTLYIDSNYFIKQ